MAYPKHIWQQLKNLTADDLIGALEKDGWTADECSGAFIPYIHPITRRRVIIHYHPQKTYGPKLLQSLLSEIGWDEDDFQRLGLVSGGTIETPATVLYIEEREVLAWGVRCKGCGDMYVVSPVLPGQPLYPHEQSTLSCHKHSTDHQYAAEEFETVWVSSTQN